MYISGQNISLDRILLMKAVDDLAFLCWSKTKDASKNRNRPESVLKKALKPDKKGDDHVVFGSVDAFEDAWKRITGG